MEKKLKRQQKQGVDQENARADLKKWRNDRNNWIGKDEEEKGKEKEKEKEKEKKEKEKEQTGEGEADQQWFKITDKNFEQWLETKPIHQKMKLIYLHEVCVNCVCRIENEKGRHATASNWGRLFVVSNGHVVAASHEGSKFTFYDAKGEKILFEREEGQMMPLDLQARLCAEMIGFNEGTGPDVGFFKLGPQGEYGRHESVYDAAEKLECQLESTCLSKAVVSMPRAEPTVGTEVFISHFGHGGTGLERSDEYTWGDQRQYAVGRIVEEPTLPAGTWGFKIEITEGRIRRGSSGAPVFRISDGAYLGVLATAPSITECYAVQSSSVNAFMNHVRMFYDNFTVNEAYSNLREHLRKRSCFMDKLEATLEELALSQKALQSTLKIKAYWVDSDQMD